MSERQTAGGRRSRAEEAAVIQQALAEATAQRAEDAPHYGPLAMHYKDRPRGVDDWRSTQRVAFGMPVDKPITPPDAADVARFAQPITIYSDAFAHGKASFCASLKPEEAQAGAAQSKPVVFGKHDAFSTPIQVFHR